MARAYAAGRVDEATWLLELLMDAHADWLGEQASSFSDRVGGGEGSSGLEAFGWVVAQALLTGPSRQVELLGASLEEEIARFLSRSLEGHAWPYVSLRPLSGGRLAAVGVDDVGRRQLLGMSAAGGSDGDLSADFLNGLVARGLSGVRLVAADDNPRLRAVMREALPGAVFQLGRDAALRTVRDAVDSPARSLAVVLINSIYAQTSARDVRAQYELVIEQLRAGSIEVAEELAAAKPDLLAFTSFPEADWPLIWSIMPGEPTVRDDVQVTHVRPNFFVVAPTQAAGSGKLLGSASALPPAAERPGVAKAEPSPPAHRHWRFWGPRLNLRIAPTEDSPALPADDAASTAHPGIEFVGVAAIVLAGLVARAVNMFNFPRYELDEGTYMSSAWAILNDQITAYPYGYGHPPLGWMQIAAWTRLTGGFFAFGDALNSGRVLMLLYAVGSSLLVYLIARRMSGRVAIGLLGAALFVFSPLGLVYQRQVFLDNIAVFWLLLAVYLAIISRSRMPYIVGAGLAFGCAVLSKETFAIFVPVMVYALWLNVSRYQRLFGVITFTYTVLGLGSALVLMAVLRGELFPYAWHLPWDHHPHLSLLDTLAVQVHRSQSEGSLIDSLETWKNWDGAFVMASIAATVFNLVVGVTKRRHLFIGLASLSYWALLLRGGVVLPFYAIALIPLGALNIALAVSALLDLTRRFGRFELAGSAVVACIALAFVANDLAHYDVIYTQHATSAQTQAMVWVRNNVPQDSVVVVNSYLYMDLRQAGGQGVGDAATYPYAHVYWNIAYDPELHDGLLQNNWDRIDYIVADSEMLRDIRTAGGPMTLLDTALTHSVLRQEFRADDNERLKADAGAGAEQIVISVYQVTHRLPPASPFNRS